MSLSVGIVGLPNVGKSTLFNALLQKQQALAANYPFATIEPNVGIVPVPDENLPLLAKVVNTTKLVPATVEFVDIAGLVAGASQGEGLGNKFLSHIRETNLIVHVVRAFRDDNIIKEGSVDPGSDYQVISTELLLADLGTLQKQAPPKGVATPEQKERWETIEHWKAVLNNDIPLRSEIHSQKQAAWAKELGLITAKRQLIVCNVSEEDLLHEVQIRAEYAAAFHCQPTDILVLCAKIEEEIASFSPAEKKEYLESLGRDRSGLELLIQQAYSTLGLQSFYTAGEKEARAWTITQGMTAPQAAGVIHSDFEKHFIKAHVLSLPLFLECEGWKNGREKGLVRQEGKAYVMQENDVVEFAIGK